MHEEDREGERESESFIRTWDDLTSDNSYISRSKRIRLGTLHLMKLMADRNEKAVKESELVQIRSIANLGKACGNWVEESKWDEDAGSVEACARHADQLMSALGPFVAQPYEHDSFLVTWRSRTETERKRRQLVNEKLARYIRKWNIPQVEITT